MSGQQSPVTPESNGSEAVEEPSSEAKPYTREDRERFWKDIQAQTGFDFYQDYVKAYKDKDDREDLRVLWRWIIDRDSNDSEDWCSIVDVIAHEDSPHKLSIRYHGTSGYALLAALRQPRKHVCVQVVIWPVKTQMSCSLTNILGLGLKIDPQFFLAVLEMHSQLPELARFDTTVDTRPLRSSHVVIDRVVATCVGHYPIDKPAAPPIVLIAGDLDFPQGFKCVASQNISSPLPFTLPKASDQEDSVPIHWSHWRWLEIYEETFSGLAEKNLGMTRCTAAIIAGVLMPLLHMNCLQIRMQFLRLRRTFLELQTLMDTKYIDQQLVNRTPSKLHHQRFWLRRSVEDSDDGMSHFERYISAEDANYLSGSSAHIRTKQERDQVHDEARRLDTEIRDFLQLVVGNLSLEESRKSLEESRKSIELSNQQILEGKRGS